MYINFRNNLTVSLANELTRANINFKYIEAEDKLLDDEFVIWNGKKNGLRIIVCDSYVYNKDYFRIFKSGVYGDKPYENEIYSGMSYRKVVSIVSRTIEQFKNRKLFYLKNRANKK